MQQFKRSLDWKETRSQWAERFFKTVRPTNRLFRGDGGGFIYIHPVNGPRLVLDKEDFFGAIHALVEVVDEGENKDGEKYVYSTFLTKATEAATLFDHPAAQQLPLLRCVIQEPVVVVFPDGSTDVTKPGFNEFGSLSYYYHVRPGSTPIEPLGTTHHLATCFSGVPFERPEHRSNLLAWMLGAITLDPLLDSPLLVVSANAQGSGKTEVIKTAGLILAGNIPAPIEFRGGEFAKQLATRFTEQDRIAFLDNIVTPGGRSFDNPLLSNLLTQGFSKRLRILGHSRSVSASGILFAASLNEAKLSTDLSTRSLLVKLYRERSQPMVPFCREYAQDHRRELYGELLGLALRPPPAQSFPEFPAFRYRRWLQFVQARIASSFGPLAIDDATSVDDAVMELFHYGLDHMDAPFEAAAFVSSIRAAADSYPGLCDRFASISSQVGKVISATRLLNARLDDTFGFSDGTRIQLTRLREGTSHIPAQYAFVRVA